jgi:hypothetical protein
LLVAFKGVYFFHDVERMKQNETKMWAGKGKRKKKGTEMQKTF